MSASLSVRLQSKWNTSSLDYAGRRMHRHGFGWRWWVENKAFFEHILISNIQDLALFFYDWTTERLFVCIMKHTEGHVPESALVCACMCAHINSHVCVHLFHLQVSCMGGCPHSVWLIRVPLAGPRSCSRRQRWRESQCFIFLHFQNSCFR